MARHPGEPDITPQMSGSLFAWLRVRGCRAGRDWRGGGFLFVSYTAADEAWATWIGAQLEAAGQRVRLQAWDSPAGENFVVWIGPVSQARSASPRRYCAHPLVARSAQATTGSCQGCPGAKDHWGTSSGVFGARDGRCLGSGRSA